MTRDELIQLHGLLVTLATEPWPEWEQTRLVLADYLEETNDPRAAHVRYFSAWMTCPDNKIPSVNYKYPSAYDAPAYIAFGVQQARRWLLSLFPEMGQPNSAEDEQWVWISQRGDCIPFGPAYRPPRETT